MNFRDRANSWLKGSFDEETKTAVRELLNGDLKIAEDAFYKRLEFGTGGMRGLMGVGTNRINRYTVGMATQGLANYMKSSFAGEKSLSVAIAYDCRNNSRLYAEVTAGVLNANGIDVYLFEDIRPTPELSFAIRHLKCDAGIVITASHNPKEYNGYKVYWNDGGQITAPHDKGIMEEVLHIDPSNVKFSGGGGKTTAIGREIDEIYLSTILKETLSKDIVSNSAPLKIVYTPLHGTGVSLIPEALRRAGFNEIISVPEQDIPDGNFPTVNSPNPEEASALAVAISRADECGADIVMGTDPDADRVGVAVRDDADNFILLNGNQIASILTYYILERKRELGLLTGREKEYYMVKTIVTTDLMKVIASEYGIDMFNVLTGFKYIAEVVKKIEGKRSFIAGGEESNGFNVGESVRDKDAVITCVMVAEAAVWARERSMTLYELLIDIYRKFGLYKEHLLSVTKKGKEGQEQISEIMGRLRDRPIESLAGSPVVLIHDYLKSESVDLVSDLRYEIELPKSDVIQYISMDNTIVSVRPSGTEPKIKYYFGVKDTLNDKGDFECINNELAAKIEELTEQFTSL